MTDFNFVIKHSQLQRFKDFCYKHQIDVLSKTKTNNHYSFTICCEYFKIVKLKRYCNQSNTPF